MSGLYIERNELLAVLSESLDRVEMEVLHVAQHHAKRVAWLCVLMGKKLYMTEEEISDLVASALLHDSALNEYKEEYENGKLKAGGNAKKHCIEGEKNLSMVPGYCVDRGYVLFHHENADGSGTFGKKEAETPIGAQLIHIANDMDSKFRLGEWEDGKLEKIQCYVKQETGILYGTLVSELFLEVLTQEYLQKLQVCEVSNFLAELPSQKIDLTKEDSRIYSLANLFAQIIDYKSPFTKNHSVGLAKKAERMASVLGWDRETAAKLYLAGALHDIGKLFVDNVVLEKPGRLNETEYIHIQSHASWTWNLLSKINGLEEICAWASYHHEKLNGTGYPFKKTGEELGDKERLLACLDIYQALTEERPYKAGMQHTKAINILREMAKKEELDAVLIEKIAQEFGSIETEEVEHIALFSCNVCGYLLEEAELPRGYRCPVCEATEDMFMRVVVK